MRLALVCALGLAACVPEHGHFPGGTPGGTPRPGGSQPGGSLDGGVPSQSGRIRGRICRISDLRGDGACPTLTGVALRVSVRETGASDLTSSDGTFDLPGTTQTNPVTLITPANDPIWHGTAFPVFLDEGGTASVQLPIMRRADLVDLAAANLVTLDESRAVVAIQVRQNGSGASGFTAGPIDGVDPLFETGDPLTWTPAGPTGPSGGVLWINVGPGNRTFILGGNGLPDGGVATTYVVPTLAGTLTLAPIDI